MTLGERGHFNRIIYNKSRLDIFPFRGFAKNFVNELTFAHRVLNFYPEVLAHFAQLSLIHPGNVHSGVFFNCVNHSDTAEWSFEIYNVVTNLHFCCAIDIKTYLFKKLFSELHHPVIVLVCHINFHAGKFRIMGSVHTFIAEILGEFIYTLEATDNKTLKVKFIRNTQV